MRDFITEPSLKDDDNEAGVRISRRHAIGNLGALAAMSALGASTAHAADAVPATEKLTNPVDLYPKPPFPHQVQEPPGLASRMQPRPDHGEHSYRGRGRLVGRKALVTGGDSGIGRAAAIAFAREGADVAIGYLPVEESDALEVVALIRAAGRKAVALPGDIRDETFCQRLVARAAQELGGLDILVNNAARQQALDSISEMTTEHFDTTIKTNLYGMFWITKAAIPHLPPGASIINTTSVQAVRASANLLDYATTKAGIIAFTRSLSKQLGPHGIRVNAVAPGPYWTPLQSSGGQPPDIVADYAASSPYGRPGQPVEIAPLYVALASQETSYATGQVWGADGGLGIF
ncbi:SDR family oxidoreductase [Burkholderia cenocepacia]|uniref:SDR family oxidoreductase n=1 Tax=Burkholderia cenocepacia TaxID=95486 RepID=UPI001E46D139|nr:SDR family oxidoreductase [Burkholderia cenocepacia]